MLSYAHHQIAAWNMDPGAAIDEMRDVSLSS